MVSVSKRSLQLLCREGTGKNKCGSAGSVQQHGVHGLLREGGHRLLCQSSVLGRASGQHRGGALPGLAGSTGDLAVLEHLNEETRLAT